MGVALGWVAVCVVGSGPVVRGDHPARGQAVTVGTVVDTGHFEKWGRRGLHHYYLLTARYTVDGADYRVAYDGPPASREPVLGSRVSVIYDVASPERARIPLTDGDRAWAVVVTGMGVAMGAWGYLGYVRPARRASKALAAVPVGA